MIRPGGTGRWSGLTLDRLSTGVRRSSGPRGRGRGGPDPLGGLSVALRRRGLALATQLGGEVGPALLQRLLRARGHRLPARHDDRRGGLRAVGQAVAGRIGRGRQRVRLGRVIARCRYRSTSIGGSSRCTAPTARRSRSTNRSRCSRARPRTRSTSRSRSRPTRSPGPAMRATRPGTPPGSPGSSCRTLLDRCRWRSFAGPVGAAAPRPASSGPSVLRWSAWVGPA